MPDRNTPNFYAQTLFAKSGKIVPLQKVKQKQHFFMSDIWGQAKGMFGKIVGQTNKALEIGKIELEIGQIKGNINITYKQIGKFVEEQKLADTESIPLSSERLQHLLKEIEADQQKIAKLKEKLAHLREGDSETQE